MGPILLMAPTSFCVQSDIFAMAPVWIFVPTPRNDHALLFADDFTRHLVDSVIGAAASTLSTLLFGAMAAHAIVRFHFVGRDVVSWTMLPLRSVALAVLAAPVFVVWGDAGLATNRRGAHGRSGRGMRRRSIAQFRASGWSVER